MKIIRPLTVTESNLLSTNANPSPYNEWAPQGFAEIASTEVGGVDLTVVDMAFSSSEDTLALIRSGSGSTEPRLYLVDSLGPEIISSSLTGSFVSIAAQPSGDRFAVAENDSITIVDGSGSIVDSVSIPPSFPGTTFAFYVQESKILWVSGRIIFLQAYITNQAEYIFRMFGFDDTNLSIIWSDEEEREKNYLKLLSAYDDEILAKRINTGVESLTRYDPSDGSFITASFGDYENLVSMVRVSGTPNVYYYTQDGDTKGLFRFDTTNGHQTLFTPSGQPLDPGRLSASPDGTMISVSSGFPSHVISTSNDDFISGTDRGSFKTDEFTTVIPFSRASDRIAVGPSQPDSIGIYNLWRTLDWTIVQADPTEYEIGDKITLDRLVYESLVDNPTLAPPQGVSSDPPQWLLIGSTNPWRMFDGTTNTRTEGGSTLEVEIQGSGIVSGLALFQMEATTVQVVVEDHTEGVVYDSGQISILGYINNWYEYFFEPYTFRPDLVLVDLPAYVDTTITVTLTSASGITRLGELVLGSILTIGEANYGTSVGITDYSRKEADAFGNFTVVQRRFTKRAEYDVTIDAGRTAATQSELAKYRTTPVVWVGDQDKPETVVYGYYRDFDIVLSNVAASDCTISVEGL